MKTLQLLIGLVLGSLFCFGQNRTFQGEIMGSSPVFVHLEEASEGSINGFIKFPANDEVLQLRGRLDPTGRLNLVGRQNSYPVISARLEDRTIQGTVILSEDANPALFYAVDLRGEYLNECYDGFAITLFEEGYVMGKTMRGGGQGAVTTSRGSDGRIYVRCDSLDALLWVEGDRLVVDPRHGRPRFMGTPEHRTAKGWVFTQTDEFFDGDSFIEFPEKDQEHTNEGQVYGDKQLFRIRPLARSEFMTRKWASAHLRPVVPCREVTDFEEATAILGERMKIVNSTDEESPYDRLLITFRDGTERMLDWFYDWDSIHNAFIAYFPEPDILMLEGEAGGDELIDFNDSTNSRYVGDPRYYATSPDGQWRLCRYYPGGAWDDSHYFLERLNLNGKRYELAEDLPFKYVDEWFWIDNRRAAIRSLSGYAEMEVIDYVR